MGDLKVKIDKSEVRRNVLTELARQGLSRLIPVGISARHVHLTEADIEALFGKGYKLHPIKPLVQPGQFAAREQVTVVGRRGRMEHVRILGPARKESQVEISVSDSFVLGEKNCPVRLSGDLEGTRGVKLIGPEGQIELKKGLIVAARHLHMNDEQARAFGIHDKQIVNIRVTGERPCLLENVICRTGSAHELEVHLDTDEANACGLGNGDLVELELPGCPQGGYGVLQADFGGAGYHKVSERGGIPEISEAGYVSGNTVPSGYAANWMSDRNQTLYGGGSLRNQSGGLYTGSLNTDAMGRGNSLGISGYMSSNAGVLSGDGSGAMAVNYVSGNAGVLAGDGRGSNFTGYISNNANVAGNGRPGMPGGAAIAPSMRPGGAPLPAVWREPTPAQKSAFYPVENSTLSAAIPEGEILELVTEADINDAYRDNKGQVYCGEKALITPLARDRATVAGIKIIRMKGKE